MDNNEITKEIDIASEDTTKTFDKAEEGDGALYRLAGGEECILEVVRTPSADCAMALRRIKWQTLSNTRFVVYSAFALILAVFAVYYAIFGTYYIAALAGVVCAFMLYIVFCGHKYLATGMDFDEKNIPNSILSIKFCVENVYVYNGTSLTVADYSQVTTFKVDKKHLYFKLKGAKTYPDGLVISKTELDGEKLNAVMKLLTKDKENKVDEAK